jgi:hypothetical protein
VTATEEAASIVALFIPPETKTWILSGSTTDEAYLEKRSDAMDGIDGMLIGDDDKKGN